MLFYLLLIVVYLACFAAVSDCGEIQITLQSVSRTDELKTVQVWQTFKLVYYLYWRWPFYRVYVCGVNM